MFLVALAAAAASPHSVTGAFGYTLGQAPPAKVAGCNKTWLAQSKTTFFGCPGDGFFNNLSIVVKRNEVMSILATRHYPAGAMQACVADVNRLKAQVRRNNPRLFEVENKVAIFDLTDQLLRAGLPWAGRSLEVAGCSLALPSSAAIIWRCSCPTPCRRTSPFSCRSWIGKAGFPLSRE